MAEKSSKNTKKKLTRPQKRAAIHDIYRQASSIRRWIMVRQEDVSGVSGVGLVAAGIEFATGEVVGAFMSKFPGSFSFPSMSVAQNVHSHKGKHDTKILYIDNLDDEELDRVLEILQNAHTDTE